MIQTGSADYSGLDHWNEEVDYFRSTVGQTLKPELRKSLETRPESELEHELQENTSVQFENTSLNFTRTQRNFFHLFIE